VADFLNRPLTELDQLYDFRGNQLRTQQVDLSGITLVHDVGPGARQDRANALSARVPGTDPLTARPDYQRIVIQTSTAAVAGGNTYQEHDPWSNPVSGSILVTPNLDPDTVDLWLLEVGVSIGAATNFTALQTAMMRKANFATDVGSTIELLQLATGVGYQAINAGTYVTANLPRINPVRAFRNNSTGRGDSLRITLVTTAAGPSARVRSEWIVVPHGQVPDILHV